jgi:hypothetical protein
LVGLRITSKNFKLGCDVAEVRFGDLPHTYKWGALFEPYRSDLMRLITLQRLKCRPKCLMSSLHSVAALFVNATKPCVAVCVVHLSLVCWRCVMNRLPALLWGRHDWVLCCDAL